MSRDTVDERIDALPASEQVQRMPALLTVTEVANLLRVSTGAVRLAIKTGRIRASRLGRVWRIAREEAQRVLTGGAC